MFRRSFPCWLAPLACGGRDGTNGNCQRFCGLGLSRCQHVALPFEESARLDYQARGMNVAGHDGLGLNIDATSGLNLAIEVPRNDDAVADNLALDGCMLAEDQCAGRDEGALHRRINSKGARGFKLTLQLDSRFEETSPFGGFMVLAFEPSPRHAVLLI